MKIVVIGGSGLIGKKLVPILRERGHEAVSASPSSGVNAVTGEGLAEALAGANVVVDVSNSPSWADDAVMEFFDKSTRNLLAAEKTAGVGHHVALSVVGADRMPDSGYMRAKVNQERLIEAGGVPFTIVRATQFFEFLGGIAGSSGEGDTSGCRPPPCNRWRPTTWRPPWPTSPRRRPRTARSNWPGPRRCPSPTSSGDSWPRAETSGRWSRTRRPVISGWRWTRVANPGPNPRLGPTRFEDWFRRAGARV